MKVKQRRGPVVRVGLAQFRIGEAPMEMTTMALGSCLGIVLHDGDASIGAMAHAMHPRRERVKNNANRAKFVDTVVSLMLDRMERRGACRLRVTAKLFGGARMFAHVKDRSSLPQIGDANVAAAREELARLGIPIVASRTGGSKGRSIVFDVSSGKVTVRDSSGIEEKV